MPSARELTARAADQIAELARTLDELYANDALFSDAVDDGEFPEFADITIGLARRLRDLNDGSARRDERAEEAGHRAYQLAHEAA